jgi:hypothetical protein
MLFAADYPFLNIFGTMILFFFWLAWLSVLVMIVGDVFSRKELSGWLKALWLVVLIFVPFFGVFGYMIVHGSDMSERNAKRAQASQARTAANGNGGAAVEIEKAKALLDNRTITQLEFDSLKAKALA